MFSKTQTGESMKGFSEGTKGRIEKLAEQIAGADAVVVGAGAGLSASAGFDYSGKRFTDNFSDFIGKYHFEDMYSAGFYPYGTPEEYWAYWSRYISINRYGQPAGKPYVALLDILKDSDYFVLTTNVDHQFQLAGFDKNRLFYTQGDYGLWQCSKPCHDKTYDNEKTVRRMVREQTGMRIPSELIPRCPVCGAPMSMNLRMDGTFVEDEGWKLAAGRYQDFLDRNSGKRTVYLELGVGMNTPGIIKYPFWRMVRENEYAVYAAINVSDVYLPKELEHRSVCILDDIGSVLECIKTAFCTAD